MKIVRNEDISEHIYHSLIQIETYKFSFSFENSILKIVNLPVDN